MNPPHLTIFEEQLTHVFHALRDALSALLTACRQDPTQPQAIARELRISRNLTWKISKVVCSSDMYQAVLHLPGEEGLEILLRAAEQHGAGPSEIAALRDAMAKLDRLITLHATDRATFDLILDGMGSPDSAARLEDSRRLAFKGNSGLWGAQARVRSTTMIIRPNRADPSRADVAMVGGVVDLRRLRARTPWPLFHAKLYHDDGTPMAHAPNEQAIDPAFASATGPKLLGPYCSSNLPDIRSVRAGGGWVYELGEGPIGNTGACTCFFGTLTEAAASRYATPDDSFAEMYSQINQPTELLQFDVLLHRELGIETRPNVRVFGRVTPHPEALPAHVIPMAERAFELSGRPPLLASPILPDYERMMTWVMDRLNVKSDEYIAYRLLMNFPPMHSTVIMRFPLATNPRA